SKLLSQNAVLAKLNRFKSDMLAFASHELKTPLAVLRISLEMIRLEVALGEHVDLLDTAEQQTIQLSELISTLLDLRKLEEGRMEYNLQAVDIRELIDKVSEQMTPLARLKRQYIGINHTQAFILADREKLQQVLINLLSNACKYSPEDSRILIQTHRGPSDVLIGIIDEGPGIAEDKQPQLFRRYAQLQGEHNDDHFKGTGLGLVLCQELIFGMGGHIGVHSKPKRGSCFWVQIPQYRPEEVADERTLLTRSNS
ncbi:MAG: HAMP domain-containing histidine kinase, partial [Gemmatimonadaceae bacterium]|nr:HAMP domain-containing histidine kinase [Gloeobacterales cyanobacterium ES-bin-141]